MKNLIETCCLLCVISIIIWTIYIIYIRICMYAEREMHYVGRGEAKRFVSRQRIDDFMLLENMFNTKFTINFSTEQFFLTCTFVWFITVINYA